MAYSISRKGKVWGLEGGCVSVRFVRQGRLQTNVYLVDDGAGGVIVVDPAEDADDIVEACDGRPVSAIFITHGHYDHTGALEALRSATGAPVHVGCFETSRITDPVPNDFGVLVEASTVDVAVADGQTVQAGATTWQVVHTPGHTEGGVCYLVEGAGGTQEGDPVLLSGDTLFNGTTGRTDFVGGSFEDMCASMARLGQLDDATIVLPGHNDPTTIGDERQRTINRLAALA